MFSLLRATADMYLLSVLPPGGEEALVWACWFAAATVESSSSPFIRQLSLIPLSAPRLPSPPPAPESSVPGEPADDEPAAGRSRRERRQQLVSVARTSVV